MDRRPPSLAPNDDDDIARYQAARLKQLAVESLTLAVEVFNRPSRIARVSGVLLLAQHSFEMLMKALIYRKQGSITPKGDDLTYSFKACLRKLHSDLLLIDQDEARTLAIVDAHRDAAHHAGVVMSEQALYVDIQAAVSLFDRLLRNGFDEKLVDIEAFAGRVLPVTARPPRELSLLAGDDLSAVTGLLTGDHRQRIRGLAQLLPYVLTDRAALDPFDVRQPTQSELLKAASELNERPWMDVFPGLATLSLETEGAGVTYSLKIVKAGEAVPVRLVKPGDAEGRLAAAIREVDVLERFPFLVSELAELSGMSSHEAQAVVHWLQLKDDPLLFRRVARGRRAKPSYEDRYSHSALARVRHAKDEGLVQQAKAAFGRGRTMVKRR